MIPNIYHFIFLTKVTRGHTPRAFNAVAYVALMSCAETQKPEKIILWSEREEPKGEWWELAKARVPNLEVRLVNLDSFEKPIPGAENYWIEKVDRFRCQVVFNYGGVYCDLDTVLLRDMVPYRADNRLLLQKEPSPFKEDNYWRPMTSITMGSKGEPLLIDIINADPEKVRTPDKKLVYAAYAARRLIDAGAPIRVEKLETGPVMWSNELTMRFFFGPPEDVKDTYLINICESVVGNLTQNITPWSIWERDSTFNCIARKYVPRPTVPVTPILSVMIDSQDRIENIMTITKYMHEHVGIDRMIVAEYDDEPKLFGLLHNRPYIHYMFSQVDRTRPYPRTKSVAIALHWVSTPVVATWDCDVVLSPGQVKAACDLILQKKAVAVTPFNCFIHIPRHFLKDVQAAQMDFSAGDKPENCLYKIDNVIGQGVVFYSTPHFKHMRGMSELFWGWGCDDDEIVIRLSKIGYPVVKLVAPGLHITHARTESGYPDKAYYTRNEGERQRIMDMSKEDILRYYGVTEQVGRYSELWEAEPYNKP